MLEPDLATGIDDQITTENHRLLEKNVRCVQNSQLIQRFDVHIDITLASDVALKRDRSGCLQFQSVNVCTGGISIDRAVAF